MSIYLLQARRNLVARKLQHVLRVFFSRDLPVPRCVRLCMRPGYLRGKNDVKKREVLHEPWFVQEALAGIYVLKLTHDAKAALAGLPPIPLPNAVLTFNFLRWLVDWLIGHIFILANVCIYLCLRDVCGEKYLLC